MNEMDQMAGRNRERGLCAIDDIGKIHSGQ